MTMRGEKARNLLYRLYNIGIHSGAAVNKYDKDNAQAEANKIIGLLFDAEPYTEQDVDELFGPPRTV